MLRSGTEQSNHQISDQRDNTSIPSGDTTSRYTRNNIQISYFFPNLQKRITLTELNEEIQVYILQKVAIATNFSNKSVVNIYDYL